jgi:phage gp16-like protein
MSARPARPVRFAPDPQRRALLAKVHLARKELALDEEDYRAVIRRVTGLSSAADASIPQLEACVAEFQRLGWGQRPPAARKPRSGRRPADHPVARRARALWISLWQLGAVDSPAESALEAFARRQLGCEALQWADQGRASALIEALRAIAKRHGWDTSGSREAQGQSLCRALYLRLRALDPFCGPLDQLLGAGWERGTAEQLWAHARALGARIEARR